MWINVRSIDGRLDIKLNDLSRLCSIKELKHKLVKPFQANSDRLQLFYSGKQLVDGHTLHDYSVKLNDVIQVRIKPEMVPEKADSTSGYESSASTVELVGDDDTIEIEQNCITNIREEECSESCFYKVGDLIDAKEDSSGSWYEAKIVKIIKVTTLDEGFHSTLESDDENLQQHSHRTANGPIGQTFALDMDKHYAYYIIYEGFEDDPPSKIKFQNVRPRSYKLIKPNDVKVGDVIMVNYNIDDPKERGFWYDVCMTKVEMHKRRVKEIVATILIGCSNTPVENCSILHFDDMFKIETPVELIERTQEMEKRMQSKPPPKRKSKPSCTHCQDNPQKKCRECACAKCGLKTNPEKQILCDECNVAYHIWCLPIPLTEIPSEDWYCAGCKVDTDEVVKAGENLKMSRKKAKMPSSIGTCNRDWGKGMACMPRSYHCTMFPKDHFGAISNVNVGSMWKFRAQVAECGIHRPSVGGIHGRAEDGAYSIVLSGGYEDDLDNGEEFMYTGSGGRDLSGNKRTSGQSFDQKLNRSNLALARNCDAKVNKVDGAVAKNWRDGKPVRVVRNYKSAKHSKYSPVEGNRYDGLYKVVKYWPETGQSGHLVWRYLLRRDDEDPAPWTEEGKLLAESRGLKMLFPPGYTEEVKSKVTKASKRKLDTSDVEANKKSKISKVLVVPSDLLKQIKSDKLNKKLWDDCLTVVDLGLAEFRQKVEDIFICICCQDVVCKPVTTVCAHNFCKDCLRRSFKAEVYTCPACREDITNIKSTLPLNISLRKILQTLFPEYENGR
uniref:RING-type E3 ubiquitin transferase n=1 Tax=Strigamia maritima TaxID=126957 RepID=T1IID2_STRMM